MNAVTKLIALDREDMTDLERELFLKDLKKVIEEYFEVDGTTDLEVTRAEEGFLVCVIFNARRIKSVRRPH